MGFTLVTYPRENRAPGCLPGGVAFARAAPTYWCAIHPQVRAEVARLRGRAAAIPDAELRAIAANVLESKRVNIDGAAAFAAFAPAPRRAAVARAQIAFQAIYDYLDVVTEQPHPTPMARSRGLHRALLAALHPGPGDPASPRREWEMLLDDGGYLADAVARCRAAIAELPSFESVRPSVERLTERIVEYQSLNVEESAASRAALAAWADASTPAGSGLHWWEVAASAGSSLGLFALLALAARRDVATAEALAIESAYFPWVGALHSLLDSLVDLDEDLSAGQHSLVSNYGGEAQLAAGLSRLVLESRTRTASLPRAGGHAAIVASMVSIYLAEAQARRPHAARARRAVLAASGNLVAPALAVMHARRVLRGR